MRSPHACMLCSSYCVSVCYPDMSPTMLSSLYLRAASNLVLTGLPARWHALKLNGKLALIPLCSWASLLQEQNATTAAPDPRNLWRPLGWSYRDINKQKRYAANVFTRTHEEMLTTMQIRVIACPSSLPVSSCLHPTPSRSLSPSLALALFYSCVCEKLAIRANCLCGLHPDPVY